MVDYNENYIQEELRKSGSTAHRKLWRTDKYNQWNKDFEYDYFPRGRVRINYGDVYIHLNPKMNMSIV